jgi:hypothetical protein
MRECRKITDAKRHLIDDIEQYLPESAGWNGYLPSIYYEPEVTDLVNRIGKGSSLYHAA